jgi:transposase
MFRTSWHTVFCGVEMAVEWGKKHMRYDGITAIGVDEIQWQKGHHYLTMVYQINEGVRRLLWVGEKRKVKTLLKFFRWFGNENAGKLEFIATDMWKPYLKVIARKAKNALNVLDRFHIVKMMNDPVNNVRKADGFKSFRTVEIALFHTLGKLPEPKFTHRFW